MYCPVCRDEFRAGFMRCRACDVDLVESLDRGETAATGVVAPAPREAAEVSRSRPPGAAAEASRSRPRGAAAEASRALPPGAAHEPKVNFCGFLVLDDARQAKGQLSEHEIEAEILIKDAADGREEFWLRVKPSDFRVTQDLLGEDESSLHDTEKVLCAGCETLVSADGDRCPQCGARFEED